MTELKVVSIDMFHTLADLESRKVALWQMLLKDKNTVELAEECTAYLENSLFGHFPQNNFLSVKSIFKTCFTELLSTVELQFDPVEATEMWAEQHSLSELFDDSMLFLNSVGKEYPICLSCDADDDMLGPLIEIYAFDYIFTSERLGSYKANADGRFFSAIINHYGVRPEEVIHIGDGRLEIVGAGKAGIVTCWLNRAGIEWSYDIEPDYEVRSLIQAASILGVDV